MQPPLKHSSFGNRGSSKTGKTPLYGKHIGRPNGRSEPESHSAGEAPEHSDGTQQPGGAFGSRSTKMFLYDACQKTNLNKHGAAVQLHRELLVGSIVAVKNKCGIQVSARVVSQLVARDGVPTYAIEFVEEDDKAKDFWGITFPPAN